MKKFLFIINLFIFLLFSININASSFKFVWENTLVEIPYGESVEKYKDLPKAHLYVDNILKEDANITYNRDGDWLCYLRDVNSNTLKDYYVWYKAYENDIYKPGTCTDYKCKVLFKIVDKEAPKITLLNDEINISSNVLDFNPLTNVLITDNAKGMLDVTYSPKFNELGLGKNIIKVSATDESGNRSEVSFNINIIDSTIPYFVKIKSDELIFDKGSQASLLGYFEAYDEMDGNITNKINYPSINTEKEGDFEYELKVTDSQGNETKEVIKVKIKDLTKPVIELNKETDILSYKIDLDNFDYLKYVSNITDNEKINYDNLSYETNLKNKVGTYYIRYKYNDGANFVYKDLIIKLVSYEKPIIETEIVPIIVGKFVDLKDYVKVTDSSDDSIKQSLVIDDESVNYYKEGSYIAKAYAINSSGISTEEEFEVKVLSKSNYDKLVSGKDNINISLYLNYILASIIILILGFVIAFIIILKKKRKL